jgi:hypothetical protein
VLEDFLQRFKTVVDTLMSHPQVRLTHVWIGPEATDAELAELSRVWKQPVPQSLETLYRQVNGLQLRWVDSAHETYDPVRDDVMSFERCEEDLWEVHGFAAGVFELPTLAALCDLESMPYRVAWDADDLHAVVIDAFGEGEDAVLFYASDARDPYTATTCDHFADLPETPPTQGLTLSGYLARVLATHASTWHRHHDNPVPLEALLRARTPLDPTRLIGQRVQYTDEGRGHSVMHGRVSSLMDATKSPDWWPFGPTVAEVDDDLGETVLVPLRCLFPATDDPYERLWAEPSAIEALLNADPSTMVRGLGPLDPSGHSTGRMESPSIRQGAWARLGLSRRLPSDTAPALLVQAADRCFRSEQRHTALELAWSANRPARPQPTSMSPERLGTLLLDVVMLTAANDRRDVPTMLGPRSSTQLRALLELLASRDPLVGYDPLTDPKTAVGFLYRALDGGPSDFDTSALSPQRGALLGLPDHRVVHAANYSWPGQ